jgi:diketogulonate reductase-like aldo/keto reductase
VQVAYSIIDRRPEKKMVAWCLKHNVKILAYGSLLGGFLSEKYLGRPEPQRFELTTQSLSKYKRTIDQWGGWMLFQVSIIPNRVKQEFEKAFLASAILLFPPFY